MEDFKIKVVDKYGTLFVKTGLVLLDNDLLYANVDGASVKLIELPDGITKISQRAFHNCNGEVRLPASVSEICSGAFKGMVRYDEEVVYFSQVEKIVIDPHNTHYVMEGDFLLSYDRTILYACISREKSLQVPSTVKVIGKQAFFGCAYLERLTLPSSVVEIQEGAFHYCVNLDEVVIPPCVEELKEYLFAECANLKHLTIPPSVKKIGSSVFYGCSSLKSLTLPKTVTDVSEFAFLQCGLVTITMLGVKKIGRRAFRACKDLVEVKMPDHCLLEGDENDWFMDTPIEAKFDHMLTLHRIMVNVMVEDFRKEKGCSRYQLTGIGSKCFELTLMYKREPLMRVVCTSEEFDEVRSWLIEQAKQKNLKLMYQSIMSKIEEK